MQFLQAQFRAFRSSEVRPHSVDREINIEQLSQSFQEVLDLLNGFLEQEEIGQEDLSLVISQVSAVIVILAKELYRAHIITENDFSVSLTSNNKFTYKEKKKMNEWHTYLVKVAKQIELIKKESEHGGLNSLLFYLKKAFASEFAIAQFTSKTSES